ncbi:hydroxysqualene dehydroxylase HpnE [Variovorax sp. dw_954]|uniref:hydroxysqualene dehydroxylase HpnE n=1 Tax=unclassified Variovorax TaxID=663243 RepID=UPI0031F680FD
MTQRIAIIGAGWSGLAAAVEAIAAGHQVHVFETAHTLGGRARAVQATLGNGTPITLDSGQHIMIGAYAQTLRLMRHVGIDVEKALLRTPLAMVFPDGNGLRLPKLPAPIDALAGILAVRGWSWRDKLALLRIAVGWQRAGFRCDASLSVADLCTGLTPRVREEMVDPLCVSALNTPTAQASGQVFLRVLRDAMFGMSGGSNLLLPRQDLGALFPDAAARWIGERGGRIAVGHRVQTIAPAAGAWQVDGEGFDAVLLACPPGEAARVVEGSGVGNSAWCAQARALRFEAIATIYLEGGHRLAEPMLALRSTPDAPAQFVFDRSQLCGDTGVWAMVVSASGTERAALEAQVCAQAVAQLGCADPRVLQTVIDKRATFACTPGLERPAMAIAPGLRACGDYVEGPYPATLEGAVLAAIAAVSALS